MVHMCCVSNRPTTLTSKSDRGVSFPPDTINAVVEVR